MNHLKKFYPQLPFVLFSLVFSLKAYLLIFDHISTGLGASSQRILLAKFIAEGIEYSFGPDWVASTFWNSVWPQGQFYIHAFIINFVKFFVSDFNFIKVAALFSVFVYSGSGLIVFRLVNRFSSFERALVAQLLFYSLEIPALFSFTGNGEVFSSFFILSSLYFLFKEEESRSTRDIVIAASFLLLGLFTRGGVILIVGYLSLVLLFLRERIYKVAIFVSIPFMYFVVKKIMNFLEGYQGVTYFNLDKYHIHEAKIYQTLQLLSKPFGSLEGIVFVIGVLVIGFNWKKLNAFFRSLALISVLHVFVVFVLIAFGKIANHYHYFIYPSIFLSMLASQARFRFFPRIRSEAAVVVVLLFFLKLNFNIHSGGGYTSFQNKIVKVDPSEIQAVREWFEKNTKQDDPIFFDFMYGHDQYLHAYLEPLNKTRNAFSYSSPPVMKNKVSVKDVRGQAAYNAKAHVYIDEFRPVYLIRSFGALKEKLLKMSGGKPNYSFLSPFLKNDQLESEYIEKRMFKIESLISFENYEVLKIRYR